MTYTRILAGYPCLATVSHPQFRWIWNLASIRIAGAQLFNHPRLAEAVAKVVEIRAVHKIELQIAEWPRMPTHLRFISEVNHALRSCVRRARLAKSPATRPGSVATIVRVTSS